LLDKFGTPDAGLIDYKEIEKAISIPRARGRFRTVVVAWRSRLLRESNLASIAEPAEGIRFLTEAERVEVGRRMIGLSARRVRRTHRWHMLVDRTQLDDIAQHKLDHQLRCSLAMATSASMETQQLGSALKAPEQLPRGRAS
jgi:hypothetical protein